MLRYSLGTLFLLVAVVALACTAWLNFSPFWAEIMVALVWVAVSVALVTALAGRGPSRMFAAGFAAVGAAYFLLAFATNLRNEGLLTERPINWLYGMQQRSTTKTPGDRDLALMDPKLAWVMRNGANNLQELSVTYDALKLIGNSTPNVAVAPAPRVLKDIGHCLWALLFAVAGGLLAQVVHKRSCRGSTTP